MNLILQKNADYQKKIKDKLIQIDADVKKAEKEKPVIVLGFRMSLRLEWERIFILT